MRDTTLHAIDAGQFSIYVDGALFLQMDRNDPIVRNMLTTNDEHVRESLKRFYENEFPDSLIAVK